MNTGTFSTPITFEEYKKLDDINKSRYYLDILQPKFKPNIMVSVWGAGKATLVTYKCGPWQNKDHSNQTECPDSEPVTLHQKYKGNCDECDLMMGVKFDNIDTSKVMWGDNLPACCGFHLNNELLKG